MTLREFKNDWNLLNEEDKHRLKVMSIAYEPLSRVDLANLWSSTGSRTSAGLSFNNANVRPYLLKLMSDGWVLEDRTIKSRISPIYREWVMRMATIDNRFKEFVIKIQRIFPYKEWTMRPRNFEVCKRDLRIAYYQNDLVGVDEILRDIRQYYSQKWIDSDFYQEVFEPFDPKWIGTFPERIQAKIVTGLLEQALSSLTNATPYFNYLDANPQLLKEGKSDLQRHVFYYNLMRGDWNALEKMNENTSSDAARMLQSGVLNSIRGNTEMALDYFRKGAKLYKKEGGDSAKYVPSIEGLFHVLTIVKSGHKGASLEAKTYTEKVSATTYGIPFSLLQAALLHQENHDISKFLSSIKPANAFQALFLAWVHYWSQIIPSERTFITLNTFYKKAEKGDYKWLAAELGLVLQGMTEIFSAPHFTPYQPDFEGKGAILQAEIGFESYLNIIKRIEPWERSLKALAGLRIKSKRGKSKSNEATARLIWLADFERGLLQPKEQKLSKSGSWSKGRNISLKRFKEDGIESATDQDNKVRKAVKRFSGYYGATEYDIDFYAAAKELVGHPLLFLYDNPDVSVELIAKEPDLVVEEKEGQFSIRFVPDFVTGGVSIVKETPTRFILMNVTENHLDIQRVIGEKGSLEIPKEAKSQLIEAVSHVSSAVTVQSVVGGMGEDLPTVEGDTRTYVHLLPIGDGFKLEFFVKPFQTEPPYFKPGAGRDNVITEVEGEKTVAQRDLNEEKQNAEAVIEACPTLQATDSYNMEWSIDEVEKCLEILLDLEPLRESGKIILEHPKGEKLRLVGQAGFGSMSMVAKKKGNWFELDGEVKVSEDRVMDFAKMLALAESTESRFIEVSKGQFVALTEQLRQKVSALNSVLNKTKKGMQLHPLASSVLDDFSDELADFQADRAWKQNRARLDEALKIKPKVPSTFKAELRDYQQEGFRWLSQLAHWGVGACLADDMGLGKTVQSLALILSRAKEGPAMVVAPASVARNWLREAEKFTPTIRPILFGAGDRVETVADLRPFDLLITSYGLMQQESELLATTTFSTLVLDEAQAIKNRATKRSKAAMELQADFRVATTGTPIENHLGELWNLFNFLNPGLLGSLQRFNEKFAVPIERYENKDKRQQLRKLLQPFILRRRKTDVLSELPPKTEVTLTVELSAEERAFYEALRRKAVEKIESIQGFGAKRFQVLAELMRLRQACCNVKMIQPESNIASSKLELFAETVKELLANGHKALVFSQFVKHLRLIEEWVQENNISYQYLDGQTPLPKREEAINAFQAGESDLFLISLKAGGTGLNLTAADYVLHLDPWWNPAVEDQASDRAHRIGQQRPVTIYRLVTEGTIEEKIVQLHGEKRDLADSLLEGTESSAKMTGEELLGLIKG